MADSDISPEADEGAVQVVPVRLGERGYYALIGTGLVTDAGSRIRPHLGRPRTVVISDEIVDDLHGNALHASLAAEGIEVERIRVSPGEASKSMSLVESLCERLMELGVERRDTLIAFGGGVVGDLVGFVAAILHRGMDFIQIPTTLLAQVDSSVGGKTGVNLAAGKNLVGAFHQPKVVLADTQVLTTLPDREYRAGYAEVVKYGALGDRDFFDWLETHAQALSSREPEALGAAVRRCVEAKAAIVAADERESGMRMLLNLGHTFGHALEALAGYDGRVLHGEAVSVGMVLAFDLSVRLGFADGNDAARLRNHLSAAGLPVTTQALGVAFDTDSLMTAMTRDKKAQGGKITLILARGLGEAFSTRDVGVRDLRALWKDHLGVGTSAPSEPIHAAAAGGASA